MKAVGIDEVVIFCVNDGAVMDAWAEDQGVSKSPMIKMMGDPSGALTEKLGMVLDHPGPMSKLGYRRSKRFAAYIDKGVFKLVKGSEGGPMGEEDPAGDDFPEDTLAPSIIKAIQALGKDEL